MAARFGEIHSELEGAAYQQLKVNSAGTAFEMVNPPTLPSYTITNDSADRAMDATDVTLDEVANVLSTLIKDLATLYDGGAAAFQWSTNEQIWPFEKDIAGNTIYCKQIDLGSLPNIGRKDVAHGISGLTMAKIRKLEGYWYLTDNLYIAFNTSSDGINIGVVTNLYVDHSQSSISIDATTNLSSANGIAKIWYIK